MSSYERLRMNLRDLMYVRGMTQAQLGRKATVSSAHISEILSGKTDLTLSTLDRLSDALGCESAELLGPRRLQTGWPT